MRTTFAYLCFSLSVITVIALLTSVNFQRSPEHCLQQPWLDMSRGC